MRFPQTVTLIRPTVGSKGDLSFPEGSSVKCGLWPRRRKQVLGGAGEVFEVTAVAFVPKGTDVQRRDRVVLASGQPGGPGRFEVLTVIPAFSDRGTVHHIGLELRDAPEADD